MYIKTISRAFAAFALFFTLAAAAQAQVSPDRVWTEVDESQFGARLVERQITPKHYRVFRLDKGMVRSILDSAPEEFSGQGRLMGTVLTLPMPNGTFERFKIEHSLVVEPGLVARYPELGQTYTGRGLDDPTATVRLDFLSRGFHAIVLSPKGTVLVDPYAASDTDHYLTYFKRDVDRSGAWTCEFEGSEFIDKLLGPSDRASELIPDTVAPEVTSGTELRTYRLALAGNWEYCNVAGSNTVAGCLAAMVTVMTRVNGVYERDLSMRMVMVANNHLIAYAGDNMSCSGACTSSTDPYSNTSSAINQNTANLNAVITSASYDIGHVFTTGSGGVANLRVPCGSNKGGGTTGLANPIGDPFSIDYVAHEMGHQWGANHTMNGCNRNISTAYEPGSGITIMAYAGICGSQDLADHSIDTFHIKSLEEIVAYSQTGTGNSCAVTTPTGNTPPAVSVVGGPTFNIPRLTPFSLTAAGSDINGDSVTYDWQEYDLGASGSGQIPNADTDGQARPILRPFLPTASPTRTFPQLQHILTSANVPPSTYGGGLLTGEVLPSISRTMTFQVIARDNHANGGGINTAAATVIVSGSSGPFTLTAPNTGVTWTGGSAQTISWNVAGTNGAPINAANIRILFSSDGGQTFPTVISGSTPNDGLETITLPNVATTAARIKIEAVGNIFFDVSDANFTVTAGTTTNTAKAPFDFDGDNKTDISIYRPSNGQWWFHRSFDGGIYALQFGVDSDVVAPADYTGDGKADVAVWRPSNGLWFILKSEDFTFYGYPFGLAGDVPVPGDYDGDQIADVGIFRPSTGGWFINRSTGGTTFGGFGSPGDKAVPGDFDGDGKNDLAIYRPSNGQWWYLRSSDSNVGVFEFGNAGDMPVPGRYTADNKTDIAFYRPSNGFWFVLRSEDSAFYAVPFGTAGDVPVPGDYDGDGTFDTAVYRPSQATWYVNRSTAGILIAQFGLGTDKPVPNAFVR